jgi:hypothetical protein
MLVNEYANPQQGAKLAVFSPTKDREMPKNGQPACGADKKSMYPVRIHAFIFKTNEVKMLINALIYS